MSLSKPQRGVARGMAGGLLLTLIGFTIAVLLRPLGPSADSIAGRLVLFALAALAPAFALAVCIARLASHRFLTPGDIEGSGLTSGSPKAKLLQALLQNTLEQLALALPVYAVWAFLGPAHLLALVPTAAAMFLLGRALFFLGYARGAAGRAIGFALTFYPTLVLLLGGLVLAVHLAGS